MSQTYITDSVTGLQWLLACNNDGTGPVVTQVTGQSAVAFVNLNSATDGLSWQLTIASGILQSQSIAQGSYPPQLVVASPNGTFYGIQIATVPVVGGTAAVIEIVGPVQAPVTAAPVSASILGTQPFGPYLEPLDEWYAAIENLICVGDANSINIPWLLGISLSVGNATTAAISKNCVVFCEPEWGFDTGSGKASMYGGSGEGGGIYVGW